jgi:hypothetical protein
VAYKYLQRYLKKTNHAKKFGTNAFLNQHILAFIPNIPKKNPFRHITSQFSTIVDIKKADIKPT